MDYEVPYREAIMLDEPKVNEGRRMGYPRIVLVLVTVILLVIGLAVGLGVGLSGNASPTPVACHSGFQKTKNQHYVDEVRIESCPSSSSLRCPQGKSDPPLIVISLDGFRAEYLLRNMTPNMEKMSSCGVHAPYMRAVFPTKTFPNHLTIATGLYPESHGIIDNLFYNLDSNRTFSLSSEESLNKHWYKGEPIWNTAKKAGKNVLTMLWPGSSVDIQGMRPDVCYYYDKSLGFRGRVEEVLTYFDDVDSSKHPDLAFLYFEQPDSAGHEQGPYGDWVQGNLTLMDNVIGLLVNGIMERGYKDCVNFVVVADHGMDESDCNKVVNISEYLDMKRHFIYDGFHSRITGKYFADFKNWVFLPSYNPMPVTETLSSLACTSYNNSKDWYIRSHNKNDLPKRYHYSNNENIDDVVLDIQPGYVVKAFHTNKCNLNMGGHGSDNTFSSMHAIFMGMGSSLKQKLVEPFENIELYNLFADIAGIRPAPNNGTYGRLHFIIKDAKEELIEIDPNLINYLTCPLPQFSTERIKIRNIARFPPLNSTCFNGSNEDILDNRLDLTSPEITESLLLHLPFEYPGSIKAKNCCKLIQRDFISAFDSKLHMPVWTSFSLRHEKSTISNVLTEDWLSDKHKCESCVRADVRVNGMIDYSKFENKNLKIKRAFLFPPGFSTNEKDISDSHISSNIVPMYEEFERGVWKEMMHLIEEYSEKYHKINVLMGPIFDHNADGLADSPDEMTKFVDDTKHVAIPSHYYVIVMRCSGGVDCLHSLQFLSFILPHSNSPGNCWDKRVDNYLRENVARMRDIELLTNLSLITGIRDKETKIRHVTFLSEEIWQRWSWLDIEAESCPKFDDESRRCKDKKHPLLLISLDGFKPDYLKRNLTPTISRLHKCGATHSSMISVYPSVTAPNHFTIITGLYPESHGVIDNKMFDVSLNESFYQDGPTALNSHWWNAQPLWSKVKENNKTAMALFWPGSDVEILGDRPTDYEPQNDNAPPQFRVNRVLDWLKRDELPDLINIYLSVVDDGGHAGGPDSVQLQESLVIADKFMQDLMDGLYKLNLLRCVDIIVVSDHGMDRISNEKLIKFNDLLPAEVLEKVFIYESAAPRISTRYSQGMVEKELVDETDRISEKELVSNLTCKNPNMAAYLKLDFPKRFHYSNNDRIDEVLIALNEPWMASKNHQWSLKGYHGWDPLYESMKALFIGWGPSFKENLHCEESFGNIELYNLLTHLLDVPPAPNNGTWGSLHHLLRNPPDFYHPPSSLHRPVHEELSNSCPFPHSEDELIAASISSMYGCPDHKFDYQRLNKTLDAQIKLEKKHVSHGKPSMQNTSDVCVLHHEEFVSAYDKKLKMPLWSAFRWSSTPTQKIMDWSSTKFIPDVRVSPLHQLRCDDIEEFKNISFVPLFHPEFSHNENDDPLLLTNIVPMCQAFIQDVWSKVLDKLFRYFPSSDFIVGPIFDKNGDGLSDLITSYPESIIPSHYFIITIPNATESPNYETVAFVLPHSSRRPSELCQSLEYFMSAHRSRVRDVELLTGLTFLTANDTSDSVRTRTHISTQTFDSHQ